MQYAVSMEPSFALGMFSAHDGVPFAGLVVQGHVHRLAHGTTTSELLADWEHSLERLRLLAASCPDDGVRLDELHHHPPVDPPGQVLCAGANYTQHVREMAFEHFRAADDGRTTQELQRAADATVEQLERSDPFLFGGLSSALCGARDDIVLPGPGHEHDWELELAVVIALGGSQIAEEEAMDHVAGYTIANDITTRDLVHRPGFPLTDTVMSKCRPTFFPVGPYIVPKEFVEDHRRLRIKLHVNGELMQDDDVAGMMHDIPRLVAYASRAATLHSGDLLLTGSPSGNAAHHGGRWLRPGDLVEGEITGLGRQVNRCVAPSPRLHEVVTATVP